MFSLRKEENFKESQVDLEEAGGVGKEEQDIVQRPDARITTAAT